MLKTSLGEVEVELYWDHAPNTCYNIYELARRGYYNGTIFHRIIQDFMIQVSFLSSFNGYLSSLSLHTFSFVF